MSSDWKKYYFNHGRLKCQNCDIEIVMIITTNPYDDGDIGPRVLPRVDGGWTCPNCASQSVKITKLD